MPVRAFPCATTFPAAARVSFMRESPSELSPFFPPAPYARSVPSTRLTIHVARPVSSSSWLFP